MILLVTTIERRDQLADALQEATGQQIVTVATLLQATSSLRAVTCEVVVFDQHRMEREPGELEVAFEHLGGAIAIVVNFAVSGVDRVVRDVKAALHRRKIEQAGARRAAAGKLLDELNETLTALLFRSEAAAQAPGLPPEAAEQLGLATQLTAQLRTQLEAASQGA